MNNNCSLAVCLFILGINDIDLIAVEYFEKLHENETHQ